MTNDEFRAPNTLSEHELIAGHGGLLMRREPCVCGGVLTAPLTADASMIAATVRAHQETVGHRLWVRRAEAARSS